VTDRTCEDEGFEGIQTKEDCADAASVLGLSDITPGSFTNYRNAAYGCNWKRKADGTYRLKWEDSESNKGIEASEKYVLICVWRPSFGRRLQKNVSKQSRNVDIHV
jgi:hypothetical protein